MKKQEVKSFFSAKAEYEETLRAYILAATSLHLNVKTILSLYDKPGFNMAKAAEILRESSYKLEQIL